MDHNELDALERLIWDYHHLNHRLEPCDCILVLGSHDPRVAEWGARLWLDGYAPWLVLSGGLGNFTRGRWDRPEADLFADIAAGMGVPRESMIVENRSTNTGENIRFSERLLDERGIAVERAILVQKPYMERRTYATARKHWPGKTLLVTSPAIALEDYPTAEITRDDVIHIMVGDLQRIRVYPAKGFQIPQEIPDEIWRAYERLVALGYDKRLIPDE